METMITREGGNVYAVATGSGEGRPMRYLWVVRHGNYEESSDDRERARSTSPSSFCESCRSQRLSGLGREQIGRLARQMRESGSGQLTLISSPADRAAESARIIADVYGLETFEQSQELWTRGGRRLSDRDLGAIDGLVAPYLSRRGHVALVTHFEAGRDYPPHVMDALGAPGGRIPDPSLGEALRLDLEEKSWELFPK